MNKENKGLNSVVTKSVRNFFRVALHHWYWFAISVVVFTALGVLYTKKAPVRLTTTSLVQLRDRTSQGSLMNNMPLLGFLGMKMDQDVQEELAIMTSRDAVTQVLNELDLMDAHAHKVDFKWVGEFPRYAFSLEPIALTQKAKQFGFVVYVEAKDYGYKVKVKRGFFNKKSYKVQDLSTPLETNVGRIQIHLNRPIGQDTIYRLIHQPRLAVIESYTKKIAVDQSNDNSKIIELSMVSDMPYRDSVVLTKLVDVYNINSALDRDFLAASTAAYINSRLDIITHELGDAEDAVADFMQKNKLTDIEKESEIFLKANSDEQQELASIETQINLVSYVEEFVNDGSKTNTLIPTNIGIDDNSLTAAITEYNDVLLHKMRILRTATANNPVVEQMDGQLASMRANIIASIASAKESLYISREGLMERDSKFNARIQSVPKQERQFIEIKRQQEIKETIYLFLYQKREENSIMQASVTPSARIVDAPKVQLDSASPKSKLVIFIFILLGLLFPVLVWYVYTYLGDKITSFDLFAQNTRLPIVGKILNNPKAGSVVIKRGENSQSSELFNSLRTNLKYTISSDVKSPVMLVSSAVANEGKSYIASNLALSLAAVGKKVVLLDLDIRKPSASTIFAVDKGNLTSYLAGENIDINSLIHTSILDKNLDIISAGTVPANPDELIQSEKLDALISELKNRYDHIVVDTAPMMLVSDTLLLNRFADLTLFVVREGCTPKDAVEYMNDLSESNRMHNMSCVYNGIRMKPSKNYGYGYTTAK